MTVSRRLLLRATAAVAGAVALGAIVVGPAYADRHDDGDDSLYRSYYADDSSDGEPDEDAEEDAKERREDAAEERRDKEADARASTKSKVKSATKSEAKSTNKSEAKSSDKTANKSSGKEENGQPEKKQRKHEGVYGLDQDPGTLAEENLDGETDPPGVYKKGLGTVEAPKIATHP